MERDKGESDGWGREERECEEGGRWSERRVRTMGGERRRECEEGGRWSERRVRTMGGERRRENASKEGGGAR